MRWLRNWITLLRLARRRLDSNEDYRSFQSYQGDLLVNFLREQRADLQQRVLDLGCGEGGYTRSLLQAGADVVSLDRRHLGALDSTVMQGDALRLPFVNNAFPFVFCASLIEHVPQPHQLLAEIKRVLRPGAQAYISFPPFYSPVGGHEFKPYHLLGERIAIPLSGLEVDGYDRCFGDWGLYRLTIREVRHMLSLTGLEICDMSTRFLPLNVAKIPLLGEFLTWHVQFVVRKPLSAARRIWYS